MDKGPSATALTTQRIWFLSLPQEVRLNIYRHLLLREATIKTRDLCPFDKGQEQPLHPAILLTSRAIYREASSVLYEENTFELAYRPGYAADNHLHDFCISKWERINHLEIHFDDYYDRIIMPATIVAMLGAAILCESLKTLRVDIYLMNHGAGYESLSWEQGKLDWKAEIPKALCSFKVQQRININLSARDESRGQQFQGFVDAVVAANGWRPEKTQSTTACTFYDSEDEAAKRLLDEEHAMSGGDGNAEVLISDRFQDTSEFTEYTWNWVLQPAN